MITKALGGIAVLMAISLALLGMAYKAQETKIESQAETIAYQSGEIERSQGELRNLKALRDKEQKISLANANAKQAEIARLNGRLKALSEVPDDEGKCLDTPVPVSLADWLRRVQAAGTGGNTQAVAPADLPD